MYVALEGIDTSGKSTQIARLKEVFKEAIFTCEPGATKLGKQIREILLHCDSISKKAEMLLFLSDRAEHYAKVLAPNLNKLIISDRSLISGIAYAKGFEFSLLQAFNAFVMDNVLPNKVILLEMSAQTLEQRLSQKGCDRIEKRGVAYLLGLQERLKEVMECLKVESLSIDASLQSEAVTAKIVEFIQK